MSFKSVNTFYHSFLLTFRTDANVIFAQYLNAEFLHYKGGGSSVWIKNMNFCLSDP